MSDRYPAHLAIPLPSIEEAERTMEATQRASEDLHRCCQEWMEFSHDLHLDAIRGLKDRGAPAAQLERYEEGFENRSAELERSRQKLKEALLAAEESVKALRGNS